MKLQKIFTTPTDLFEPVTFKDGINFIYGYKEEPQNSEEVETNSESKEEFDQKQNYYATGDNSLNGIGKSLFLDFIDFCLLGYFHPKSNTRLSKAYNKGFLSGHSINLEFIIDEKLYKIIRSFEYPFKVTFIVNDSSPHQMNLNDLKPILFELIFYRANYSGAFENKWYRNLLNFFMKIQKISGERFTNPLRFIDGKEIELIQYHLFLLNIDNEFLYKKQHIQDEINHLQKSVEVNKKFLLSKFSLNNVKNAYSKIRDLTNKINKLQKEIEKFNLFEYYDDKQNRADEITSQIKLLLLQISSEEQMMEDYEYNSKLDPESKKQKNYKYVADIYSEISNSAMAEFIRNSLDSAVKFRQKLFESRKSFLRYQHGLHYDSINNKKEKVKKLEEEKDSIIKELSTIETVKDLKNAYTEINSLQNQRTELKSQLELYNSILSKISDLEKEKRKTNSELNTLLSKNLQTISNFKNILTDFYKSIFGFSYSTSPFFISQYDKGKIELNILPDDKYSHGKNQGRTLVYYLAVLFYQIKNDLKGPRFLIHDGIFDSLDKSHFISLYEFCQNKLKQEYDFQYLVTLNQQGEFDQVFGDNELINHEKLKEEAILTLTPSKKLLGKTY